MQTPPVSIVIVSRGRPDLLRRAVTGVSQLDYAPFELVVVACPAGIRAVKDHPLAAHIKTVLFDEPNISTARNLGIDQSAGDIVAFLDDDAVPEPQWLRELVAPFQDSKVAATGGYVIGRNGFSYQWRARSLAPDGFASDLELTGDASVVFNPSVMGAIKTEGTNMALRRSILGELGGFDPAFSYFMDETDMNMRLALAGKCTAIAPRARVHHGYAPSRRRAQDRTPLDLTEIGRSTAIFVTRYMPEPERKTVWRHHVRAQHARCLRAMQRGPLGADDVIRLLRQFRRAYPPKPSCKETTFPTISPDPAPFKPCPNGTNAQKIAISGFNWQARTKIAQAKAAVAAGKIVHLFLLSPTIRYHRRVFQDGIWMQTGGIYGKSMRNEAVFRLTRLKKRVASELKKCDISAKINF